METAPTPHRRSALGGVVGLALAAALVRSIPPGEAPTHSALPCAVPFQTGENPLAIPVAGCSGGPAAGGRVQLLLGVPLNINHASAVDMDALPRVGLSLAQKIVDHRASHGPFGSVKALERVRGVGSATVRRLAPYVTADP